MDMYWACSICLWLLWGLVGATALFILYLCVLYILMKIGDRQVLRRMLKGAVIVDGYVLRPIDDRWTEIEHPDGKKTYWPKEWGEWVPRSED